MSFDFTETGRPAFFSPEPDYDILLFRLSLYAFDRLSPLDQLVKVEQLRRCKLDNVLDIVEQGPEESEEAFRRRELFKKLSYHDQLWCFLCPVIAKFKHERQLKGDQDEESGSDRKFCFANFFFGFSKIWFEGQSKRSQDMLIQQLSRQVTGVTLNDRHADESEEDFKLRKFTELCKKVADFNVQDGFLQSAEAKLRNWILDPSKRLVGELQDPDSAAHLLSRLSIFGFSRLSAEYQQSLIEDLSKQVEGHLAAVEDITDDQEDIGVKTFTKLFYQVCVSTRIDMFRLMRKILFQQYCLSEAVSFFMESSCQDQNEIMDELALLRSLTKPVIEKFSGETEEDFRLRKFTKLYMERDFSWGSSIPVPKKCAEFLKQVQEGTFDYNDECPPYAEFLFDVSTAWLKTRCANYQRNPIPFILFGKVDIRDVLARLPGESDEDFRLRRFVESFKRLEFNSQERIIDYMEDALFGDLDPTFVREEPFRLLGLGRPVYSGWTQHSEESPGPFDSKWIVMEEIQKDKGAAPNSTRGAGAAAAGTGAVGSATTTQAGGGTRQGTSRP